MNALVVYDSLYGNTEKIAHAIRDGLAVAIGDTGSVTAESVGDAQLDMLANTDLLVIGGPTHGSRPSQPMQDFLAGITAGQVDGIAFAAFDTRTDMDELTGAMRFFGKIFDHFGYAAPKISARLEQQGAHSVKAPEGFIVDDKEGPLADGELARAKEWARQVAALAQQSAALP